MKPLRTFAEYQRLEQRNNEIFRKSVLRVKGGLVLDANRVPLHEQQEWDRNENLLEAFEKANPNAPYDWKKMEGF